MKNCKIKRICLIAALILIVCLGIAGIVAYMTAQDTAVNEFTVGELSIDLQEPAWDAQPDSDGDGIPDIAEELISLEEITKDPQIYNDGSNDAYVFLEVIVPYKNVMTSNANGTRNEAADTQLFTWTVNEGWVQVGNMTDNGDGTYTYVYAWAADDKMVTLLPGDTTGALFDKVIYANVVDGEIPKDEELSVIVNAYGIQTNNINGGITDPDGIWKVMTNLLAKSTQETPPAPVAENITDTSVTLATVDGCEYAVSSSVATYSRSFELEWQDSPVFTGLTPGVEYTFYMRYKETETANASEIVSVNISTIKSTVAAPDAPTVEEVTENSVTLTAVNGAEYSMDGITWQDSPTFTDLDSGVEYTFYVRYKETETAYASEIRSVTLTTTITYTDFVITAENRAKVGYTGVENEDLVIPATFMDTDGTWYKVTGIGDAAFQGCYTLTSITLPESLLTIGDEAFMGCNRLTSVTIPDNVTTIGASAFLNCLRLATVTTSANSKLITIGDKAFFDLVSLRSIILPAGLTSIGWSALNTDDDLTVYYRGTEAQWAAITNSSAVSGYATVQYNYTD